MGGSSVVMLFSNEQEVCFISCWDRCLIAGLDSLLSKQEGEKKIQKCALLEHLVLWHKYLNFLLCLNECWQNMCKPLNPVEGLQMYICRLVFLVKAGWILVIQKRTWLQKGSIMAILLDLPTWILFLYICFLRKLYWFS